MKFISMDCSKCGGHIDIDTSNEFIKCKYCDTPYRIENNDGHLNIIRLEERVSNLEKEQSGIKETISKVSIDQIQMQFENLFLRVVDGAQGTQTLAMLVSSQKTEYLQINDLEYSQLKSTGFFESDREPFTTVNVLEVGEYLKSEFPDIDINIMPFPHFGSHSRMGISGMSIRGCIKISYNKPSAVILLVVRENLFIKNKRVLGKNAMQNHSRLMELLMRRYKNVAFK